MSLDEKLFGFCFRFLQQIFSAKDKETPSAVLLAPVKTRLLFFARALSGQSLQVKEAEGLGGTSGPTIYLPTKMDLFAQVEDNQRALLWRTIYGCQVLASDLFLPGGQTLSQTEQGVVSVLLAPLVLHQLDSELPQHRELLSGSAALLSPEPDSKTNLLSAWLRTQLGLPITDIRLDDAQQSALAQLAALSARSIAQAIQVLPHAMRVLAAQRMHSAALPKELALIGLVLPKEAPSEPKQTPKHVIKEEALPTGTELSKRVRQRVRKIQLEQNQLADNPLTHAFEKVKTADDYRGGQKPLDGEDELAEHADALKELDLRSVVRSHKRTESIYRADVDLDVEAAEIVEEQSASETLVRYDEWDDAKHKYRPGFCQVLIRRADPTIADADLHSYLGKVRTAHKRSHTELLRRLSVLRNHRKWVNRQLEGPELDLLALVDRHAHLRAGHTPPDRLYLQQRLAHRDLATLVLVDSSMSMDSWVENHRVMDLAREALIVLGDVLCRFDDQVAIAGFYSNTHDDCRYIRYKDFADPFSAAYPRLLSQAPCGYTRIGPALRHATAELGQVAARKRLLLLISDGKPTDYDRYEGRYGIADCRQAIREARAKGMFVRMLAIDGRAKAHLAEMFGAGHYQVLSHPQKLVTILTALYTQLVG